MARKTIKTETTPETKAPEAPTSAPPTPSADPVPSPAKAKASGKGKPQPMPKKAGKKVADAAQKRSKAAASTAPQAPASKKKVNGHQVQLPAPASAPAPESTAAPAPASAAAPSWPLDGFQEVSSTALQATIMQADAPCEVCGKQLSFGGEALGRVASLTDGTIVRGKFMARCMDHGADLESPIVAGAGPDPAEREWQATQDESEMITEAIQGAMSVIAPPENPPRRAVAIYLAFLSAASYAAAEMGIDYENAIEDFANHYGEVLEQRRRAQSQANAAPA